MPNEENLPRSNADSINAVVQAGLQGVDTIQDQIDKQNGEHGLRLDRTIFYVARVAIWLAGLIIAAFGIVWATHIVLDDEHRWLSQPELQGLERILFSGILVSLAGKYFGKFKGLTGTNKG